MWQKIDLWPRGRAGIEARYRVEDTHIYVYIQGTDHVLDWIHHVTPGAMRREIEAGEMLYRRLLPYTGARTVTIGGHSLGGAVAVVLANRYYTDGGYLPYLYIFGGKRPPEAPRSDYTAYRHRGDLVPYVWPWRSALRDTQRFGSWLPIWAAHQPREYMRFIARAGLARGE